MALLAGAATSLLSQPEDRDYVVPMRASIRLALCAALLAPTACRPPRVLQIERRGEVQAGMPAGSLRSSSGELTDGEIEHQQQGKWATRIAWEPDPRAGPPTDEEALLAAGLPHGKLLRSARAEVRAGDPRTQGPLVVDGHPAALIHGDDVDVIVWRCDKSGRLFTYRSEGEPGFPLEALLDSITCHQPRMKLANAQVPAANAMALGDGWSLSKRTHAGAIYLRGDAMLELFAGRRTGPTDDLVLAAHLAPAWIEAAGLTEVHVETGERANGPSGHPAVALRGEAKLDGRPVRWEYLEWRCIERARTYGAVVVSQAPNAIAPPQAGWTGHDAALLAVRCHG